MATNSPLMLENIWFDKYRCEDAERAWHERLAQQGAGGASATGTRTSSLVNEIVRARQQIQNSLKKEAVAPSNDVIARLEKMELENKELRKVTEDLRKIIQKLESRVTSLEGGKPAPAPAPTPAKKEEEEDDDDDFELFGDDDDDEEEDAAAAALREKRLAEYAAKKAKKAPVIAKSSLLIDVKPWDDETDMGKLEECVRSIVMDGLLWGASKLVPVGYGIKKLQINAVIEDDKISTDDLEEQIVAFEDYVQSMDIAAFNKI